MKSTSIPLCNFPSQLSALCNQYLSLPYVPNQTNLVYFRVYMLLVLVDLLLLSSMSTYSLRNKNKNVAKHWMQFEPCQNRSHYQEKASALGFKDTATLRFGHSDVVFDLFIETRFLHLITLLSNFSQLF